MGRRIRRNRRDDDRGVRGVSAGPLMGRFALLQLGLPTAQNRHKLVLELGCLTQTC